MTNRKDAVAIAGSGDGDVEDHDGANLAASGGNDVAQLADDDSDEDSDNVGEKSAAKRRRSLGTQGAKNLKQPKRAGQTSDDANSGAMRAMRDSASQHSELVKYSKRRARERRGILHLQRVLRACKAVRNRPRTGRKCVQGMRYCSALSAVRRAG